MKINFKNSNPEELLTQRVLVDLAKDRRDNVNIGTAISIFITPKKSLKNLFGLEKKINRDLRLYVDNITIDPSLVLGKELLSVFVDGSVKDLTPGKAVPVTLTGLETSFQLIFHPSSIKDATRRQGDGSNIFDISFRVVLKDLKDNEICAQPVKIEVELVNLDFRPEVKIRMKETEKKFTRNADIIKIGKIEVRDTHTLRRIPAIGLTVSLRASIKGKPLDSSVVWIDALPEPLCRYADGSRLSFEVEKLDTAASGGDNAFAAEIVCDLDKVGNPFDEPDGKARIDLHLDLDYHSVLNASSEEHLFVPDAAFDVLKNVEQPELHVELEDQGEIRTLNLDAPRTERLQEIRYLPSHNLRSRIKVILRNTAEEGQDGTGIYVSNISLKVSKPEEAVFVPATRFASIDTMVHLDNGTPDQISLPNKGASRRNIEIIFDGSQVGEFYMARGPRGKDYLVPLHLDLSFDYVIDEEGWSEGRDENLARKHFKAKLILPVYQRPNPDWLSIDFGTSAIVSMHSGNLLDLHGRKNALHGISGKDDSYEQGTKFLSSNVIFRNVSTGEIKEDAPLSQLMGDNDSTAVYQQLAVCLSPSSRTEADNARNILPCLKMMVGYGVLPDIENYSDFKYWCHPFIGEPLSRVGLVVKDSTVEIEKEYSPLAYVDNIFSQVYQQFFRHYIESVVNDGAHRINQLVLTVPNTYSPYHLERIRRIISENVKSLNIRNIRFVSESDAVACYYQACWADINKDLKGGGDIEDLRHDETVLVFDMGAGTLDLTLFTRSKNRKTELDSVKVLGKIGISKAGNYLDALLAELLSRNISKFENYADPDKIKTGDDLKGAIALKNLIKNEIKPNLVKGAVVRIGKNPDLGIREEMEIDVNSVILNTPEFKNFIKECTEDLLKNFFSFFRLAKDIKVDTILMSGRSAKLAAIKEALDRELPKYSAPNARIIEVKNLGNPDEDKTKTIVAEGAVYYCQLIGKTSKITFETDNLSACYGVTYYDSTGLKYVELLNPRTSRPTSEEVKEGIVVRTYQSEEKTLDLSYSMGPGRPMTLIQTFHNNPVKALSEGQTEYITEIATFDPNTIDHRESTRVSLEVTPDNMMIFRINGDETPEMSSNKIDVTSATARRSFWPVIKR